MLKQLLIFIALFTICFCEKVSVYKCNKASKEDFENKDTSDSILLLEIDDCAGDSCVIHKGKNKTFSINFQSILQSGNITHNVSMYIEVWAKFHLADRFQIEQFIQYGQNICKNETKIASVQIGQNICDGGFKGGSSYSFKYTMNIIPLLLPTAKVELMLILLDKSDEKKHVVVSCGYIHAAFED